MSWVTGISGKSTRAIGSQVDNIKVLLSAHYPDLFGEVEQSFDNPVDPKVLTHDRSLAKNAAITSVAHALDNGREMTPGEIAMEVAARYREYMENSELLKVERASRARG